MGTAKKYQHKGAATLQVKKFTALADELNAIVRRLCPHPIDLRLHSCTTDNNRVHYRGPMVVREEWVPIVEGAGSLDNWGKVARIWRAAQRVPLLHGAPQSEAKPGFVNSPVLRKTYWPGVGGKTDDGGQRVALFELVSA